MFSSDQKKKKKDQILEKQFSFQNKAENALYMPLDTQNVLRHSH